MKKIREFEFRGKGVYDELWHYGFLWKSPDGKCWIRQFSERIFDKFHFADFEVIPESVGQRTGLRDCKDKEIYGGDIVKFLVDGIKEVSEVFFDEGGFSVNAKNTDPGYKPFLSEIEAEVIGNVYEGEGENEK